MKRCQQREARRRSKSCERAAARKVKEARRAEQQERTDKRERIRAEKKAGKEHFIRAFVHAFR